MAILVVAWGLGCASGAPAARPAAAPANPAAAPPAAATTAPTTGGAATSAAPAGAAAFDAVKDAAKREGTVVVAGPGLPGLRTGLSEGFQTATGVAVEYLGLNPGEAVARIDRESKASAPTIDVYISGTSSCWTMAERGQIDDVKPLLVDPEIQRASVWRDGAPRLTKPSPTLPSDFDCGLQTSEYVMTDLFVNTDLVPVASIQSWKDLLKPEYRGKIAASDPRQPGPGQTTFAYLDKLFGEEYLRELLLGQQVTFTTDLRQLAEWVARGNYPIGLALVQATVEPLRAERLPIERVFPADGPGIRTGGFGSVQKIKGGPHPSAAMLFINWFASRDAQALYEREALEMSLRTDTPHQVPDYVMPRPGVEYPLNDYDPGYFFNDRVPAIARLQEMLGR
jgi:iron(III) transport system substrate-binding protein